MTNSQISSKWQPEKSALPTLSKYKSLANTIKRHLHFLPNDDTYNIHLKSLIVSSRGETSGVKYVFTSLANYFKFHFVNFQKEPTGKKAVTIMDPVPIVTPPAGVLAK